VPPNVLAVNITVWFACPGDGETVKLVESGVGPDVVKNSDITGAPASLEVNDANPQLSSIV